MHLFYAFTEGAEKAFVADLVSDEKRGTAFGLFNFSIGLGALPASIIFGFLYSYFDKVFPGLRRHSCLWFWWYYCIDLNDTACSKNKRAFKRL